MKNIYNKGVYRDSQWVKHLSPFLKKICSHKWRRSANKEINSKLEGAEPDLDNSVSEDKSKD